MLRSVLVLMAVTAAPAWAVGERVSLPSNGAIADQLRATLCISMDCSQGGDASVTAKVLKGKKVELKVFSPAGKLKTTIKAPLDASGLMSSTDLVAATSGLIAGIEAPEKTDKEKTDKEKKSAAAPKAKKKAALKLAAKLRGNHSPG
jgi:hypothetical protein